MATQRQIDANRENALRSTGPRTEAGKAASSANALSHGLTAADTVVLPEEDTDAFERLREGVIADLDPAGALQAALAQRVAVLLWRLDRATRLEAELFVHGQLAMLRSRADQALESRRPPAPPRRAAGRIDGGAGKDQAVQRPDRRGHVCSGALRPDTGGASGERAHL